MHSGYKGSTEAILEAELLTTAAPADGRTRRNPPAELLLNSCPTQQRGAKGVAFGQEAVGPFSSLQYIAGTVRQES